MIASPGSESKPGLLLALAGFAMLSLGDAVIKTMSDEWPSTALAATRFAMGALGLSALLLVREGRGPMPAADRGLHALRGLAVTLATTGFFGALMFMPLAEATAISFTSPILTALLAAPVLGERVRGATWGASLLAFAGVLAILRPNFLSLGWPALLPLVSALGMSLLMILNSKAAGRGSALAMQAWAAVFAALMLGSVALVGHFGWGGGLAIDRPHWSVLARCALVAISASTAHWLIFVGTVRAGPARVAPMIHVQLLVAGLIGWLGFGHVPDLAAMAGVGLIVLAGLWLWRAERRA